MKPFRLALALGLLAAIGCGRPGAESGSVPNDDAPAAENPEITLAENRFAGELLRVSSLGSEHVVAAPASLYGLLGVLLNASENKTLEAISKAMQMEEPRTDKLNPALRFQHDITAQLEGYESYESIWFIWPILLDPTMPQQMLESFGVHVTRMGTFREDVRRKIEADIAEKAPYADPHVTVRLTKDDVYLCYSFVRVDLTIPEGAARTSLQKGDLRAQQIALDEGMDLLVIPYDEKIKLGPDLFIGWEEGGSGEDIAFPTIDFTYHDSLQSTFKELGLEHLFTGPVDMRYLSVELQGMYPMKSLEQVIDVSISGSETAQPVIWALRESQTGAVLLCGIQR